MDLRKIEGLLKDRGFASLRNVVNRQSISDLALGRNKCGIYFLEFADETYYIGKSVDIPRRFLQHRKLHADIKAFASKRAAKSNLDFVETEEIAFFERRIPLRNIAKTSYPHIEDCEFDELVPVGSQKEFLARTDPTIHTFIRLIDTVQRDKNDFKLKCLEKISSFSPDILEICKRYVRRCIIEPYMTEMIFWSVSCLPYYKGRDQGIFARFNLNWQEVFCIYWSDSGSRVEFSWHLRRSKFSDGGILYLASRYPDVWYEEGGYPKGGPDQGNIWAKEPATAMALLDDKDFLIAAKDFNLNRMRAGANPFARYHCMALADLILPRRS